jgi:hypothetical protein
MPAAQRGTPNFGDDKDRPDPIKPGEDVTIDRPDKPDDKAKDDKPGTRPDDNRPGDRWGNGDDDKTNDKPEAKTRPVFAEEEMSNSDLAARIRDLENTLAATRAGMPLTLIPEHGAGPGMEVSDSWGQYEQEQAKAADAASPKK